jgi:hypothetical protein
MLATIILAKTCIHVESQGYDAQCKATYLMLTVQIDSGAQPVSYTMGAGATFPGVTWPGLQADNHLHPMPRLGMRGTIPPLSHTSSCRGS